MLLAYRLAYAIVLGVFLGNILVEGITGTLSVRASPFSVVTVISICSLLAVVVWFRRTRPVVFWILVLFWEILFTCYAWFGPAAPFPLHELHTLTSDQVAREASGHYVRAWALFLVLFAWFLSLPIVRIMGNIRPASSQ